jgi:hypothetical protein
LGEILKGRKVKGMKSVILVLVAIMMLSGCAYTNISEVQNKFEKGNMHAISNSIQKGDSTIHYYYVNYGEGFRSYGWYCWEYICDKTGHILKKREYWIGNDKAFDEFRNKLK